MSTLPRHDRKNCNTELRQHELTQQRLEQKSQINCDHKTYCNRARQNSVYQALSEIGRVQKTIHILKTLDDEDYRRRMGHELNKGEASHDLSRFLCFGKEGVLRGREFGDQIHTFSCLSVLHNAVVAWNMIWIGEIVDNLRADGREIDDETLSHVTPLVRKHLNPFGRYHFDLDRIRNATAASDQKP